jgi:electron transport complex protein RnfG
MPILVLSLVCLFMSGALAVSDSITRPVIEEASAERALAVKKEILPLAEEFVLLEVEGLPKRIVEVYGTPDNQGYIFSITTSGFGGEISILCGIDPDGKIIRSVVMSHSETPGFGDRVFVAVNESEEKGEHFDAVAGATVTSNAYREGIQDAFAAFEIIKGVQP